MKRILFLIALLVSFSGSAFAVPGDTITFTAGDKNPNAIYREFISRVFGGTNSYVTFAPDTGIIYPYLESTTNLTLAYYQSGVIVTIFPSASNTQFTLPTCSTPGLDFYLVSGLAGNTWKVEVQSTDTINFTGDTRGVGITNTSAAAGDQIEMFCGQANNWLVKNKLGTWVAGS